MATTSLTPILDYKCYSYRLKIDNEKFSPFDKIFKVGSCGVEMDNLIFEMDESDKFYSFVHSDWAQDDRAYYHQKIGLDGDTGDGSQTIYDIQVR